MKLNQIGMSLVESMVGLAIAGGIGLVLMRQQETAGKIQTKANINQEVNSIASVVQTSLANRAVCTLSLLGKGVNDVVPALVDGKINPLFPAAGQAEYIVDTVNNHLSIDQELNGIKVQSMKIVEKTDPVTSIKKDFLSVIFDVDPKGIKKKIGGKTIGKLYLLQGTKVAGKYVSCHSEQSNILNSAVDQACKSLNGNWNSSLNKCVLQTVPLYLNTVDGSLMTVPRELFQTTYPTCSNCGSGCNSCPSGWAETGRSCPMGGSCGFRRWRNCTSTCIQSVGMSPVFGDVMKR